MRGWKKNARFSLIFGATLSGALRDFSRTRRVGGRQSTLVARSEQEIGGEEQQGEIKNIAYDEKNKKLKRMRKRRTKRLERDGKRGKNGERNDKGIRSIQNSLP